MVIMFSVCKYYDFFLVIYFTRKLNFTKLSQYLHNKFKHSIRLKRFENLIKEFLLRYISDIYITMMSPCTRFDHRICLRKYKQRVTKIVEEKSSRPSMYYFITPILQFRIHSTYMKNEDKEKRRSYCIQNRMYTKDNTVLLQNYLLHFPDSFA